MQSLKPGLYIVPTPIGNLQDITFRAIEVLKQVEFILCEDTRVTSRLLDAYKIAKRMRRCDEHVGHLLEKDVIASIAAGNAVALVSDAGTPLISDPGHRLASNLLQQGVFIDVLPGPCSVISALCLSGLPTENFAFLGFFPRKDSQRIYMLKTVLSVQQTSIFFESPARLLQTLKCVHEVLGDRECAVVREISKVHQEVARGTAQELAARFSEGVRGEIVFLISPAPDDGDDLVAIKEKIMLFLENGVSPSSAATIVSKMLDVSRSKVYALTQQLIGSK